METLNIAYRVDITSQIKNFTPFFLCMQVMFLFMSLPENERTENEHINRYFAYHLSLHHFRYLPQFLSIFLLDCLSCGFHSDSIRHKANKSKDLPANLDSLQFGSLSMVNKRE